MPNEFAALKPVESSMFSRAGYDEATWALLLEFKSTHEIRSYRGVSPETADEALSAKSLGRWWNANVKGNSSWEYDVLGADPSQMPEPPKASINRVTTVAPPSETLIGMRTAPFGLRRERL